MKSARLLFLHKRVEESSNVATEALRGATGTGNRANGMFKNRKIAEFCCM